MAGQALKTWGMAEEFSWVFTYMRGPVSAALRVLLRLYREQLLKGGIRV